MILGMSISLFTWIHVALSLLGIFTGFIVLLAMLKSKPVPIWTAIFLVTTILTSVTGFFFRSASFGPPHVVGVISLIVLVAAVLALYVYSLSGAWRRIYVTSAVAALYFNVFVGVVQAFQKLSFLKPLAPTQSEPPFFVAQAIVLAVFIALGVAAARSFHPAAVVPVLKPARA